MAKILSHPRVYSFLHIPVQSGSDTVLGDMKREYNRAEFQRVVDFLRERYFCFCFLHSGTLHPLLSPYHFTMCTDILHHFIKE